MTSIGFTASGPATRSVPLVARSVETSREPATDSARTVPLRTPPAVPAGWVRVGSIRLRPAMGYLLSWAAVLFTVLFVVLLSGYLMLWALGVLASVSKALAIVLGEPLSGSEILPALQPQNAVPVLALASFVMAALAFAAGFAAMLVHNAVSSLTGGLLIRIRPADRTVARRSF